MKMMSLSAVMNGVTAHKISKTITYLLNESKVGIYSPESFDVLVVESEVSQFLWPRWGLDYGAEILEVLERDSFISQPLLVHAFSIGGYTFTQLLSHVSGYSQRHQSLTDRIKGQIYDSLVIGSLEHMATGLGKTLFPQLESLVRQASLLYFRAFRKQTVDYFNSSIDLFWNHPVTSPALFFFSENDPFCDYNRMEELIECWRSTGMAVEGKKWKESIHAAHLRQYPKEYLAVLENFLQSLNLVPLKAKM